MDGDPKALGATGGEVGGQEPPVEELSAEEAFENDLERHLEALSGTDDEVFPELEYKLQAANPEHHRSEHYRGIFSKIKRSAAQFPTMSTAFNRLEEAVRGGKTFRRLTHGKDARYRIDLTDKGHKMPEAGIQARLEPLKNVLMIKWGMSATEDSPALFRAERKVKLFTSTIGRLGDIRNFSESKIKALPEPFKELFGKKAGNVKVYPGVETRSDREKITIFRPASYEGRLFIVALEVAQDEGIASPVASDDPADNYCIDQLEVEVKEIIDAQTGINALKYPEKIMLPKGKKKERAMEEREVRLDIALPVLREEALSLCREHDLVPMLDPKPKLGFDRNKVSATTKAGWQRMKTARDDLVAKDTSAWSGLDLGEVRNLSL